MTDREISEKLNIVHQTVSKRRRATLKELREYLVKEGFEWPTSEANPGSCDPGGCEWRRGTPLPP